MVSPEDKEQPSALIPRFLSPLATEVIVVICDQVCVFMSVLRNVLILAGKGDFFCLTKIVCCDKGDCRHISPVRSVLLLLYVCVCVHVRGSERDMASDMVLGGRRSKWRSMRSYELKLL